MKPVQLLAGAILALGSLLATEARAESQLRLCIRHDPKTFDPLLVDEESGETVRYLTGGVLIRLNRATQQLEPELATAWKIAAGGRRITFTLRENVRFSDGTALTTRDVAATLARMMDPAIHSPVGDSFRASNGPARVHEHRPNQVSIEFASAIAGLERLFDQIVITRADKPDSREAVLGPFRVAEHRSGSHLLLQRNPNYWRRDARGRAMPYLDSVRLDIQGNRDIEMLRFQRRELHMISKLDAIAFEQLKAGSPAAAVDAGPSFDNEMIWFNQVQRAPLPDYKKAWFRSQIFRRAISGAINRQDLVRLVYRGHAQPAAGPFSEANRLWFNPAVKPHAYASEESLRQLQRAGFRQKGGRLYDSSGNLVEFSLITNSGNKARSRIAALVQQDLAKIGVRLNVVTLDFPALIERISKTYAYEACLLGLVNVDTDPNAQMNVWLSSAANHQWNPRQKAPETLWEAELDRLMQSQASSLSYEKRRQSFNRVQEIISEQVPFIYLVTKNALAAVDPRLKNVSPSPLTPQLLWNVHKLTFGDAVRAGR
jgi:peptide/nickel transport system substrate-binding protein